MTIWASSLNNRPIIIVTDRWTPPFSRLWGCRNRCSITVSLGLGWWCCCLSLFFLFCCGSLLLCSLWFTLALLRCGLDWHVHFLHEFLLMLPRWVLLHYHGWRLFDHLHGLRLPSLWGVFGDPFCLLFNLFSLLFDDFQDFLFNGFAF